MPLIQTHMRQPKVSKRGRPSNSFLASLKKKPSKIDWQSLASACASSLVQGDWASDVLVEFSYVTKLPKDFPKSFIEENKEFSVVRKFKARALLMWLNKRGYTPITFEQIEYQKRSWARKMMHFEKKLLDIGEDDEYNDSNMTEEDSSGDSLGS